MNYFNNISNPDDARKIYRTLVKMHHPDLGGDTEVMKAINLQYESLLRRLDGREYTRQQPTTDGRSTWVYRYNEKTEREIMAAVARVMRAIHESNQAIDCTVVGTWLWVTGETKPARHLLKAAGLWWNAKRSAWNWHPKGFSTRYNDNLTLDEIIGQGQRMTNNMIAG